MVVVASPPAILFKFNREELLSVFDTVSSTVVNRTPPTQFGAVNLQNVPSSSLQESASLRLKCGTEQESVFSVHCC